jgi:glycerol-1-phosphate dehydrogenase [NAD(P)+]
MPTPNQPQPRVALPTYGRDLLSSLPRELFASALVHTQPDPWRQVRSHFDPARTRLTMVSTMDLACVKAETEVMPCPSAVFGIGGGLAMDRAKYSAWRKGCPLVLVPAILSVDAAFIKATAVRHAGRVRYVGEVYPEHLLVDFDLLQAAPPLLNRAGAGDLLSIFTALWDWREAHARLGEAYDPRVAAEARAILDDLLAGAGAVREATEAGLRLLAEGFVRKTRLCEQVGSSRPEEGSEHYYAYCLEALAGRPFVHGQVVGLGIRLAGRLQGQDLAPIEAFLKELGLECSPEALGVSRERAREALVGMGDYLKAEPQLLPGVFHFRGGLTPEEADELIDRC